MTNYIPNYDKKRKILARREEKLRRLIQQGAVGEKLIIAAEDVRQSRIGWLKSLRANPVKEYRRIEKYREAGERLQFLLEMPLEAILAEFGARLPSEDTEFQIVASSGQTQSPPSADQPAADGLA